LGLQGAGRLIKKLEIRLWAAENGDARPKRAEDYVCSLLPCQAANNCDGVLICLLFLCVAVIPAWAQGKQTVISDVPPVAVSGFVGWFNPVQNVVIHDSTNNNESLCSRQHIRFSWTSRKQSSDLHYADTHRWAFAGKDKSFIGFYPVLVQRRLSQPINQLDLKPTTCAHNFGWCAPVIGSLESPFSRADFYRDNVNPRTFGIYDGFGIQQGSISRFALQRYAVPYSLSGLGSFSGLLGNGQQGQNNHPSCRPFGPSEERRQDSIPTWRVPFGMGYVLLGMIFIRFSEKSTFVRLCGFLCGLLGGAFVLNGYVDCQPEHQHESRQVFQHSREIVTQKYLTTFSYCNTFNLMANVLGAEKQTAIIAALAEGSSIRSIERITGVHRDKIIRLGVKVEQGCTKMMDSKMQDLDCNLCT
jgi:hypothetical protein